MPHRSFSLYAARYRSREVSLESPFAPEKNLPVSIRIGNHRIPDELMLDFTPIESPMDAVLIIELAETVSWSDYVEALQALPYPQSDAGFLVLPLGNYYQKQGFLTLRELLHAEKADTRSRLVALLQWALTQFESEAAVARLADVLYRLRSKHLQARPRWNKLFVKSNTLTLPWQQAPQGF